MLTVEQKIKRKSRITASNAACLFDAHPFRSKFEYWAELTCHAVEPDDFGDGDEIDPRELGSHLESGVLSLYAAKRRRRGDEIEIRPNVEQKLTTSDKFPLLGATIDSWQTVNGTEAVVEAKTEGGRPYKDRHGNLIVPTEEWAVAPPLAYQAQAQCQLMVTGLAFVTIPVLILSERRIVWHDVYPHAAFQSRLAEEAERFWNEHVLTGIPPEPTDYAKAVKLLPKLVPERSGTVCLEGPEAKAIDLDIHWCQTQKRQAEAMVREAEAALRKAQYKLSQLVGDAAEATIEDTGVTYRLKNIRVTEATIKRRGYEWLRCDRKTPKTEEVSE